MTVTPIAGRALAPHEREYVRRVLLHLRDVPRARRGEVERSIVEHLMDRPATADEDALWTDLGEPHAYARTAREDHGLGPERNDWYARWTAIGRRRRWAGSILLLALAASLAAGGLTLRWWLRWEAHLSSPAFALCRLDADDRATCAGPGIERREAAGRSEAIIDYESGGRFSVLLSPFNSSGRTVRILSIDAPTPPTSLYRFDSVVLDDPTTRTPEAVPFAPFGLGPHDANPDRWVVRFRFDDCRNFRRGDGVSFDELAIRYEAMGRVRTTTLTLPSRVSIVMRTDCPTS